MIFGKTMDSNMFIQMTNFQNYTWPVVGSKVWYTQVYVALVGDCNNDDL
jgi:hypothetical protein